MSSIDERAREPVNALLSATDETVLEGGMVLALETRGREAGSYGMHREDLVESLPSGPRVRTPGHAYDPLAPAPALETRVREAGTYGMHLEDLVETLPSGSIVHTQDYPYDRLMTALG